MLLPTVALAQPKKPDKGGGKPPPAAAGDKKPPTGTGAAAGGELDLDQPDQPKTDQPKTDQPPAGGGECIPGINCAGDETGGVDLKAAAKKSIKAEVYAMEQIPNLRKRRFEIQPYWGFSLNDQFVSHPGPGLALNYYISHVLAVGINGNLYAGLNGDSEFNFQHRRATRVAVPLNEYQWSAALNFTYVPVYGKFSGFKSFIFWYDIYVVGGVGALSTRPIPVIDPDNRRFEFEPKLAFNLGLGLRIFLNRWLAANLELRDYIYPEKLESLSIPNGPLCSKSDTACLANPNSPSNSKTWMQDGVSVTNHVAAQIGLSIFLPFEVTYKLPK
jgi:outer membrane beta-barrel protein